MKNYATTQDQDLRLIQLLAQFRPVAFRLPIIRGLTLSGVKSLNYQFFRWGRKLPNLKKLIIMEINLTVGRNSEAGSADIKEIRSDQFQSSVCLSRATVFVKIIANKYYYVVMFPGCWKKITRSHHVLRFLPIPIRLIPLNRVLYLSIRCKTE